MKTDKLEEIFIAICSDLIGCKKNLQLYPNGHPRVDEAIEQVRRKLLLYQQQRGRPFNVQSTSDRGEDSPKNVPEGLRRLVYLLKWNLIEKATISSSAPASELSQFLAGLSDGTPNCRPAPGASNEDALLRDASTWEHIRLSFFEPHDLLEELPADSDLYGRRAGIHCAKNLAPDLATLPEEVRNAVQGQLAEPKFLLRICQLRTALGKHLPAAGRDPKDPVDLIEEVLRAAVTGETKRCEGNEAPKADPIVSTIHQFVDYVERNVELLSGQVHSYPEAGAIKLEKQHVDVVAGMDDRLSPLVNQLQVLKERLQFLFQTDRHVHAADEASGADGAPAPAKPAAAPRQDAGEPPRSKPSSLPLAPLSSESVPALGKPGGPQTVPGAPKPSVELACDAPLDLYLLVVLDLLSRSNRDEEIGQRMPGIVKTLQAAARNSQFLCKAIKEICEFINENGNSEAEEILVAMLAKVDEINKLVGMVETVLLPEGGTPLVEKVLRTLSKKDHRLATTLLFEMCRSSQDPVRSVGQSQVLPLAANPEVLYRWATSDPEQFFKADVLGRIASEIAAEKISEAFRIYFSRTNPLAAADFIGRLPVGIDGAEQILYAAMEKGELKIRCLAIENLWKFPSKVAVATLQSIVRHHNAIEDSSAAELEAALKALVRINDASTAAFLAEVRQGRQMLAFLYKKDIRKTLAKLESDKALR